MISARFSRTSSVPRTTRSTRRASGPSVSLESLEARQLLALTPHMIADVNAVGADTVPSDFVLAGGVTFFRTNPDGRGMELWRTDGTSDGTYRIKQIAPNNDGDIRGITAYQDKVYFYTNDDVHGMELWSSDGTEAGTTLVKDIAPGSSGSNGRNPREQPSFAIANNRLFFSASDPDHGMELWQTDGTTEGTVLVADIHPTGDSGPSRLIALGNQVLFYADDGVHGRELWKSDGTTNGTTLVADVTPGPEGDRYPAAMASVGSVVYFAGRTPELGSELWRTDGTAEGTRLVADLIPGPNDARPGNLLDVHGTLFFTASTNGSYGLYRSDGTEAGTTVVKDGFIDARGLTAVGNNVFFIGRDGTGNVEISGHELWISDGTTDGTRVAKDIVPGAGHGVPFQQQMAVIGNRVYFSGFEDATRQELWSSDGTPEGTQLIKDINPGDRRGLLYFGTETLYAIGDRLYFGASDGVAGIEPWISDGTPEGTRLIKDVTTGTSGSEPKLWTGVGGTVVFGADDGVHGFEPWRTDGTTLGTSIVKDILPGEDHSAITWNFGKAFETLDGNAYFTANDTPGSVNRVWRTDGSELGTIELPSEFSSFTAPQLFTTAGGQVFFAASQEEGNRELWKSDGTVSGISLVKDIYPGSTTFYETYTYPNSANPTELLADGGRLFFAATDTNGRELWVSDGTEAGTHQVADLNPGTHELYGVAVGNGSYPSNLTRMSDGRIFFTAADPEHGRELWVTDGTQAGTYLVKDIMPGGGAVQYGDIFGGSGGTAPNSSQPVSLTELNGQLYFFADDGTNGRELWVSDGTEMGTHMVKDLRSTGSGIPFLHIFPTLTSHAGKLHYFADDGEHGFEPWVSDGTEAGTHLVRDIRPGPDGSSNPAFNPFFISIVPIGQRVVYRANDGSTGYELWSSDGTEQGTSLVADIAPGPAGSYPYAMALVNGRLYFGADDQVHGREPWVIVEDLAPSVFGDVSLDGIFNSTDLILVFQRGEYEDSADNNSTFDEGDWNGDGDFNSRDLMEAFQKGIYALAAVPATEEWIDDVVRDVAGDVLDAMSRRKNRAEATGENDDA